MIRVWCCIVFLSTALPLLAPDSSAQDCIDYDLLPSEINSLDDGLDILFVAADGDYFCYATADAAGLGLRLVWGVAAAGSAPEVLGEYESTVGIPRALACEGTLVSVAFRTYGTTARGWLLIDFADAGSPALRFQASSTTRISDLEMSGDLMCLAAYGNGFLVMDISNPDAPLEVASLPDVDGAFAVVEDAGVWYAGGTIGEVAFVRAYNLTTPAVPVLLGENTDTYSFGFGSVPLSLATQGGDVAVMRDDYHIDHLGDTIHNLNLQVLDFSDPAAIVQTGRLYLGSTYTSAPAMGNGMVYVSVVKKLTYIEKTGGSWSEKYGRATESVGIPLCVSGDRVFGGDGTRLVEYADGIGAPSPVAGTVPSSYSEGMDLEITDTHAFISWFTPSDGSIGSEDTGFVAVYDLSDPALPVPLHTFQAFMGFPIGYFVIHGEYAHTDLGSFHWPTGDLAAAHVNMYRDGCVAGDVLYAVMYRGFRVFDLSIPDTPTAVGADYLDTLPLSTLIQGEGHLYVFGADLSIFDLADPLVPAQLSTDPFSETINGAVIQDGKLFLAGHSGLLIYDLATPSQPVLLGQLALGNCRDVAVSGETAYVTAGSAGMMAVDVTDPSAPVLLGDYYAGSDAKVVETRGGYVFALSGRELTVLEPQCPVPSVVEDGGLPQIASPLMRFDPPYPNPFNPITSLRFELDRAGPMELTIYDGAGRLLRTLVDGYRAAGPHVVQWDGCDESGMMVSAGIYFAQARSLDGVMTRKLALIK